MSSDLLRRMREYLELWQDLGDSIPTIEGMAIQCGVSDALLYQYSKETDESHAPYREIYRECLATQKRELLNRGLTSEFNSTITKLVLSANHGMAEKSETKSDVTSSGALDVTIEFVHGKNAEDPAES